MAWEGNVWIRSAMPSNYISITKGIYLSGDQKKQNNNPKLRSRHDTREVNLFEVLVYSLGLFLKDNERQVGVRVLQNECSGK